MLIYFSDIFNMYYYQSPYGKEKLELKPFVGIKRKLRKKTRLILGLKNCIKRMKVGE